VLHRFSFSGGDGAVGSPGGALALGEDGSLYGTANGIGLCFSACTFGGDAFKLTPSRPGEPWKETILYGFSDFTDPWNPLVEGADGALYGMTSYRCLGHCSLGTLFKLTPPMGPGGAWTETVLYSTLPDSTNPGLTQFQGAFYYTTAGGGNGCGTVSRIVPPAQSGGGWRNEVLFAFSGSRTSCPQYGVLVEPDIIFGTTDGVSEEGQLRAGTVFALTQSRPGAQWDLEILHKFPAFGETDGSGPTGAVVAGPNGVIFGATALGGSQGCGTVWQLTPPAAPGGRWTEKILHHFQGADGCNPVSIGAGMGGVLYGTAAAGGSTGNGTVFEIVP
jgi:uncharacterized repeat protein (TIGR03803 family)